MTGAFPDRVLEDRVAQVLDLRQAGFLALVDVGPAGQVQHEQGGGAGTTGAEVEVQGALGAVDVVGHPALGGAGAAVAAGVAHDVVIGQHPGGGRTHRAEHGERVVDDGAQRLGVPRGHQEVEGESRVQTVRADVGGTHLGGRGCPLDGAAPVLQPLSSIWMARTPRASFSGG